jgi:hypothetical protein
LLLRRRIRRYFKQFYAERSALDEVDIMHNLAPVLQEAVSVYLLHGAARSPRRDGGNPGKRGGRRRALPYAADRSSRTRSSARCPRACCGR